MGGATAQQDKEEEREGEEEEEWWGAHTLRGLSRRWWAGWEGVERSRKCTWVGGRRRGTLRQYDRGDSRGGGREGAEQEAGGGRRGPGSLLEGLPVDGTCSVLLVLPLRHPHLLEGVQRCQDGAAAETREFMGLHVFFF